MLCNQKCVFKLKIPVAESKNIVNDEEIIQINFTSNAQNQNGKNHKHTN